MGTQKKKKKWRKLTHPDKIKERQRKKKAKHVSKKKKNQHIGGEVQREGYFWKFILWASPLSFLSILERKLFGGSKKKHLSPTIYFHSFSPNQIHFKKVFFPIFSSKFSIHPISHPNKHTLKFKGCHGIFPLKKYVIH